MENMRRDGVERQGREGVGVERALVHGSRFQRIIKIIPSTRSRHP